MNREINKSGFVGKVKQVKQDKYEANVVDGNIILGPKSYRDDFVNFTAIYNKDGNKIEEVFYRIDGSLQKSTYKYNENGKKIETIDSYPNGNLIFQTVHTYNETGQHIKDDHYKGKSEKYGLEYKHKTIYSYNEQGYVIEETDFTLFDDLISKSTFQCDHAGNRLMVKIKNEKGMIDLFTYTYDNRGSIISEKYYNDDTFDLLEMKYTELSNNCYKYDDFGNVIEKVSKIYDTITRYKYEYDNIGNWKKRVEFLSDTATSIVLREIEYWA